MTEFPHASVVASDGMCVFCGLPASDPGPCRSRGKVATLTPKIPARPPACLEARTAVVAIRRKHRNFTATNYTVVFPAGWSKKQLLDYVRAVHVGHSARIVKWNETHSVKGEAFMWITNPRAFSNYKKGELA